MNTTRIRVAVLGIGLLLIAGFYYAQSPGGGGAPSQLLVLFLHESAMDMTQLTTEQQSIPSAKIVVDYLDTHCYGGRDGWRYWDNDTDASRENAVFQEILKTANEKYTDEDGPIVIISNGTSAGVAGPWEDSPEKQLAVLQKWGGP